MLVTWLKVGDLRWCNNSWNSSIEDPHLINPTSWVGCFTVLLKTLLNICKHVRRMDRGLVEHLDEPAMTLCLYGFLCVFGIQYMYCKSSSSSLVSISNEVRTDLRFSSTSDAEKSVRLYVWFPGIELSPSSSCKRNVSFRQMHSRWMLCNCLRGLWQNSHEDAKVL